MSYLLPHLHSGFAVDQAILSVSAWAWRGAAREDSSGAAAITAARACRRSIGRVAPLTGGGSRGHHPIRT